MTDPTLPSPSSCATLPSAPEPMAVEFEPTNICNARCTVCPRHGLGRAGYLDRELYEDVLAQYERLRPGYAANVISGALSYPSVVFAGAGEPLLHREIASLVGEATRRGFATEIYSNGSRLTVPLARGLVEAGLRSLRLSFWGTTAREYEAAMRLRFDDTLERLRVTLPILRESGIALTINWLAAPGVTSTAPQVRAFWDAVAPGIEVDMETTPENRAGNLVEPAIAAGLEFFPPVDFRKPIYCSFAYFTDFITWDGRAIMCAPDYFGRTMVLGSLRTETVAELAERRREAIEQRRFRSTCAQCRRYRNDSTEFWDQVLPLSEIRKYRYDDQAPRQ